LVVFSSSTKIKDSLDANEFAEDDAVSKAGFVWARGAVKKVGFDPSEVNDVSSGAAR
jgi:hypothetical protein